MSYRTQPIDCPRCRIALVRPEVRDLWRCAGCAGELVAEGELIAELLRVAPDLVPEGTPRLPTRSRAPTGPPAPCPVCRATMQPVFLGGIDVDRCHADELIWFDASELARVLARAAAQHEVRQRGWLERVVRGLVG